MAHPDRHAVWYQALLDDNAKLRHDNDCLREENTRLKAEVQRLRQAMNKEVRTAREKPFGESTPSSKMLFKPNSEEERIARKGGAKTGHVGHGRKLLKAEEVDERITLERPEKCDVCGGDLIDIKADERTVRVAVPPHYRTLHYTVLRGWCTSCNREVKQTIKGVMPHFAASNQLLAQNAIDRFVHSLTVGTISARTGLGKSTILAEFHSLAKIFNPCMDRILEEYRKSPVKFADETTWRCDGRNGYTYGFFTPTLALFRFRETRAHTVPEEVFGAENDIGTLVTDRYAGYNVFKGKRQLCLEHLKRKCKSLLEKEPENREYLKFVPTFIDLLIQAMTLRNRAKNDCEYYDEARRLKIEIMKMANSQARDPALQEFQCVFRENEDKLFQWVDNRDVPAENNLSERGVRKTVIARKTCFGSQGDQGLSDREVVQSVVMTTYLRYADPVAKLTEALDAYAADQSANIADLLFPVKAEQGETVATGSGAPSGKKKRGEAA